MNANNNLSVDSQPTRINFFKNPFTAWSSHLYNLKSCLASWCQSWTYCLVPLFGQRAKHGVLEINPWWHHKEHCCVTYVSQVSDGNTTNQVSIAPAETTLLLSPSEQNQSSTEPFGKRNFQKTPRVNNAVFGNLLSFQPIVWSCLTGMQDKERNIAKWEEYGSFE